MYPAVVCTIPLGLPVDPDVYKIKSGSSEFMISASKFESTFSNSSCHQTSLPFIIFMLVLVLFNTIHFSIEGAFFMASSDILFNGITLSPLKPPSAVSKILQSASLILSDNDFDENPANTTE